MNVAKGISSSKKAQDVSDPPRSKLRSVFDIDYFLEKTLTLLIKDSIPGCRRVCKRWHEACRQLSVETRVLSNLEKLPDFFRSFPNARSLEFDVANPFDFEQYLGFFNKLESLSVNLTLEAESSKWDLNFLNSLINVPSLDLSLQNEKAIVVDCPPFPSHKSDAFAPSRKYY